MRVTIKIEKTTFFSNQENQIYNEFIDKGEIKKALALIQKSRTTDQKRIANKHYHEGELWYFLSEYEKAKESYQYALSYDDSNPIYFRTLARIESTLGRYVQSLNCLEEALVLLNNDSTQLFERTNVLNDIGRAHENLKHYDLAFEFYKKSLHETKKIAGKEHNSYAATLSNIAHLHNHLGNMAAAKKLYREVLSIDLKINGKDHIQTGTTYNNIGGVYLKSNNYEKALEFFNKALSILKKKLHKYNFKIAILEMNIAICLSGLGMKKNAIEKYKLAESLLLYSFDDLHPDISLVRSNLAHCLYYSGDYNSAIKYMVLAIDGYVATYGELDKDTRELKKNLKLMKNRSL